MSPARIIFLFTVVCVILLAFIGILAVWDVLNDDVAWRTMATLAILGGAAASLGAIQKLLGVKS